MTKPDIKPGMPLDIIFENEINSAGAHYMKAVVYDYDDQSLTISQTSPALGRRFINRKILITFLVRVSSRTLRFGFSGLIGDIVENYTISSGNTVEALILKRTGQPEPTDFRMYFRVKPPSDSDLSLFWEDQKVSLMDISIGGAKFSYPKRFMFRAGDAIKLRLIIRDSIFNIDARVRHVQEPPLAATNRNLQYVSVQFHHSDKKAETSLGRAILDIERSLLSKGAM